MFHKPTLIITTSVWFLDIGTHHWNTPWYSCDINDAQAWLVGVSCAYFIGITAIIFWNAVGIIWQVLARADMGLFGWTLNDLGFDYNYTVNQSDGRLTVSTA